MVPLCKKQGEEATPGLARVSRACAGAPVQGTIGAAVAAAVRRKDSGPDCLRSCLLRRAIMKQQQQPVMSAASTGAAAATAVPAFLSKLWALVGDAPSNQLITWSQVGVLERGQPRRGPGRGNLPFPPDCRPGALLSRSDSLSPVRPPRAGQKARQEAVYEEGGVIRRESRFVPRVKVCLEITDGPRILSLPAPVSVVSPGPASRPRPSRGRGRREASTVTWRTARPPRDPPSGKHHCRRAWTETGTGGWQRLWGVCRTGEIPWCR